MHSSLSSAGYLFPGVTQRFTTLCGIAVMLLLFSPDLWAQIAEDNVTQGAVNTIGDRMIAFQETTVDLMRTTFWGLVTIDLVWTFTLLALNDEGLNGVIREIVIRIMFIGFFYWLLLNGINIVSLIYETLVSLGSRASGAGFDDLAPDKVVDLGLQLMKSSASDWGLTNLGTGFANLIASLIAFLCLLWIAANLALVIVQFYIVGYGGIFLLGFGGSRWTSGYAVAYVKYALASCTKIFIMLVIVGIGYSILRDTMDNTGDALSQGWALAAFCVILAYLASNAPTQAQGLLDGVNNQAAVSAGKALTLAASSIAAIKSGGASAIGTGAAMDSAASLGRAQASAGGLRGAGQTAVNTIANLGKAAASDATSSIMGTRKPGGVFPGGNTGTMGGRMAAGMNAQKKKIIAQKS